MTYNINDISVGDVEQYSDIKNEHMNEYIANMYRYKLSDALKNVLKYVSTMNINVNNNEPWKYFEKDDGNDLMIAFLRESYYHIRVICDMFSPFMPKVSKDIKNKFMMNEDDTTITLPRDKPVSYFQKVTRT
jgi:methionyl-tRNA synthetase